MSHYEAPPPELADELPSLPYSLHSKKKSIAIHWGILLLPTSVLTIVLYFIVKYATNADEGIALTVPTAILGVFTILTFAARTWQLIRKDSTCRPVGASRWHCDYLTWNLILGTIAATAVLASGSAADPPNVRQSAMPQAIVLYLASAQLLVTGVFAHFGWTTPVTLSSTQRGEPMRPGVFVLVEDVVGVDGAGGKQFREAWIRRYEASPAFQSMLRALNWFWGSTSLVVAMMTTAFVFAVDNEDVAFALGWTLCWVWAAIGAAITTIWVKRALHNETQDRLRKLSDGSVTMIETQV